MCVSVVHKYMSMNYLCAWFSQQLDEGIRCPGIEVTDGRKPWVLELVRLTSQPYLQPLFPTSKVHIARLPMKKTIVSTYCMRAATSTY